MAGLTLAELTFIDGIVFGFLGLALQLCMLKIAYMLGQDIGGGGS